MIKIHLDPRTKLVMIFAVSFIVMVNAVSTIEWIVRIIVTLIPVFLLANEGKHVSAIRFLLCYAAAILLLKYYISAESTGILSALLLGYCGIVAQFMPAMIMAWYVIHTTKIGEFMSAMQKMHIPDGISVSLAVVMRFFPTIKEECLSINDAMKMRDISFGGGRITKMIEYRLVPLMFSCLNIGDELSAAAVTRGLGAQVRRTSPVQLKIKAVDWLMIVIFLLSMIIFVISKYFR